MLQAVICDDVAYDRKQLKKALEHLHLNFPEKINVIEYKSAKSLLSDLEGGNLKHVDVIFMDIFMKDVSGMEAAKRLYELEIKVPIIFITTSADFAVESYDVQAVGYLVKPLDVSKLEASMERLFAKIERPRVALKVKGQTHYFYKDEIMWLESNNKIVVVHLVGNSTIEIRDQLNNLEVLLDDKRFLRCHQSFLVNMDYISDVDSEFCMKDGTRVPIRVRSRKAVTDAYYRYFVNYALHELSKEDTSCMS